MIVGIGTDICEVVRIERALVRHGDRFAEKVLGPRELQVWRARSARQWLRALSRRAHATIVACLLV